MSDKILVIGEAPAWQWNLFYSTAAKKLGFETIDLDPTKLTFTIGKGDSVNFCKDEDLIKSAKYIVFLAEKYEHLYYLLTLSLNKSHRILNGSAILKYPTFSNKFIQSILIGNIGDFIPQTQFNYNREYSINNYPAIIKKVTGCAGTGVYKIDTIDASKQLLSEVKEDVLVQDFIPSKVESVDYRAIYLDNKIIRCVKRFIKEGSFKGNNTKSIEIFDLDGLFVEQLKNIATALSIDFCAFDFQIIDNKLYIYEINRFPYFSKVNEAYGNNLAEDVLNFLIRTK